MVLQITVVDDGSPVPEGGRTSWSWDDVFKDPLTVGDVLAAAEYFHGALGEGWSGWVKRAPFAMNFHTSFQGREREWVRVWNLVRALHDAPNISGLVKRELGSSAWQVFRCAMMALEIGGRFRGHGHEVAFIETRDLASPSDLLVTLVERPITVELKALYHPDQLEPWQRLMDWLCIELQRLGVHPAAFDVALLPPALEQRDLVLASIVAANARPIREAIDLPEGCGNLTPSALNGGEWTFPEPERPGLDRLHTKIVRAWRKKFEEADGPALLLVHAPVLIGRRVGEVVDVLQNAMETLPLLSGVVVYDEWLWEPPRSRFALKERFRFAQGACEGLARAVLGVPNPKALNPLAPQELALLVGPGMHW